MGKGYLAIHGKTQPTSSTEELQGRCIPTGMGSWRPRLRASAKPADQIKPKRNGKSFPSEGDLYFSRGIQRLRVIYIRTKICWHVTCQKKIFCTSNFRIQRPGRFTPDMLVLDLQSETPEKPFRQVHWRFYESTQEKGTVLAKLFQNLRRQHQAVFFLVHSFKGSLFFVDCESKGGLKWNKNKHWHSPVQSNDELCVRGERNCKASH